MNVLCGSRVMSRGSAPAERRAASGTAARNVAAATTQHQPQRRRRRLCYTAAACTPAVSWSRPFAHAYACGGCVWVPRVARWHKRVRVAQAAVATATLHRRSRTSPAPVADTGDYHAARDSYDDALPAAPRGVIRLGVARRCSVCWCAWAAALAHALKVWRRVAVKKGRWVDRFAQASRHRRP